MVTKIRHAFIVTSAINSKFGVYTPEQRLEQTIGTVTSIKSKLPNAKIIIMECCGTPIKPEQEAALRDVSDVFIDCSNDPDVKELYDNDNWDVVKNGTEIMCFGRILAVLQNESLLEDVDRVHKMSGRYTLNNDFDVDFYDREDIQNRIVIGPKVQSQFPPGVTQQDWQYMARLWSWPQYMTNDIVEVYNKSFLFFAERLANGGYIDIEHVLAKFLPQEHVTEILKTGVEGNIAPNGAPIVN